MTQHEQDLDGRRIAFLATEGVEQVELTEPWRAVEQAGGRPELISLDTKPFRGWNHFDKADEFTPDRAVADAHADDYVALVLPGGVANPDQLRMDENAVRFVREFFEQGKPIGVICHGPWTLIDAGLVDGRQITSWPSVRTDLVNAGAHWVDRDVVTDEWLTSSRNPDDLPAFCSAIVEQFARAGSRTSA
jgi:protease I